jgi:hypothetical protein
MQIRPVLSVIRHCKHLSRPVTLENVYKNTVWPPEISKIFGIVLSNDF